MTWEFKSPRVHHIQGRDMSEEYEYAIGYIIDDGDGYVDVRPKYRCNSWEEAVSACEDSEDYFVPMRRLITRWEAPDTE